MNGFFNLSDRNIKQPIPLLPLCDSCGLYRGCKSAKMPVYGSGKKGILIIGENPGKNEDSEGRPFCGKSGNYLRNVLYKNDVVMDRDCWLYNSTICHKEKDGKNAAPSDKEIDACRPNVIKTIKQLQPKTIILLGGAAVKSVLRWTWKSDVGNISRWVGFQSPDQQLNAYICSNYHPSYCQRQAQQKDNTASIFFERYIEKAVSKTNRPWKIVPDYKKEIIRVYDELDVSKFIDRFIESGKPCSYDFETSTLKPDSKDARIVCCSISDGKTTISYPWQGKTVEATKKFLLSPIFKIGSNQKFEIRWSMNILGIIPVNTGYDTMIGSHVLDNRRGITSIKFQSYVLLGFPEYNSHIEPFLHSPGSNTPNRINQVDTNELLTYCGIDSLVEYKVAMKQMKMLNMEPI